MLPFPVDFRPGAWAGLAGSHPVAAARALDDSSRAFGNCWGGWFIAAGDPPTSAHQPKLSMSAGPIATWSPRWFGSHLVDRLMKAGEEVLCLTTPSPVARPTCAWWITRARVHPPRRHRPIKLEVDNIWHLACPASRFITRPIRSKPLKPLSRHLQHARLGPPREGSPLLASTSESMEIQMHPQPESYSGRVNQLASAPVMTRANASLKPWHDYQRMHGCEIRVARIFNTYGPRMLADDGRVVSNFIVQALRGQPITLYGDGSQTRSFCYVDDLIDGLIRLMHCDFTGPINLGNPNEFTIRQLAEQVRFRINPNLLLIEKPLPADDPRQRQPDIALAQRELCWQPHVSLDQGLAPTIAWFKQLLG